MNEGRPLVAYSFAHVKRQPRSLDELNANVALRLQRAIQIIFEKASRRQILQHFADWSTYREAPFVSREKFRHAVDVARRARADLLLADIRELLARTKQERIVECADFLNALDIDVWDASLGRTWQSITGNERRLLIANARQMSGSRSMVVKDGIRLSGAEKTTTASANRRKGNRANRHNANERALRHREFVLKELAKLPAGKKLSPSVLAAALNAAGVSSARGGSWSHNTAKDLIARIGKLSGGPSTT